MVIEDTRIVTIHYSVADENGLTLDSTLNREPIVYMHGTGSVIPGLQQALLGKATGDQIQVTLEPKDAYGSVKGELIQKLPRASFADVPDLSPGRQLQATNPDGSIQLFVVQEMDDEFVTVDVNHPLAGLVLTFNVLVQEVREASEQEIAMSQAH